MACTTGESVAVSGNVAVVGSSHDNAVGNDSGSAYVFRYNGNQWVEEAKLVAADGSGGDWFGLAVAVSASAVTYICTRRGKRAGDSAQ